MIIAYSILGAITALFFAFDWVKSGRECHDTSTVIWCLIAGALWPFSLYSVFLETRREP